MAFNASTRSRLANLLTASSRSLRSTSTNPISKATSILAQAPSSSSSLPSPYLFVRLFHHQTIFLLHTQHSGPHGVLLDALQKQHRLPSKNPFANELPEGINIPEEIRRLKTSLKWLFQVWPSTMSPKSLIPSIKSQPQLSHPSTSSSSSPQPSKTPRKPQKSSRTASEQQLYDVLDYLKSKRIAIRRLPRLPWLLTADPVVLEANVANVQRMLSIKSFSVAISFCSLPRHKLIEVASLWHKDRFPKGSFPNRIEWMAHELSCPSEDISDMMSRYPKMLTIPIPIISQVLCLLDGIVKPESIVNDPWVFTGNLKTMQIRVSQLREKCIEEVKPWVFRSPQRLFDKFLDKKSEQRSLLGDNKDITGFLIEKLNLPGEYAAKEILKRTPSLKRSSVIKLNEMIEFLHGEGYTSEQIRDTPRILAHSVDTVSERLNELSTCNKSTVTLHLLCRTSKDYRSIIRKLKNKAPT